MPKMPKIEMNNCKKYKMNLKSVMSCCFLTFNLSHCILYCVP